MGVRPEQPKRRLGRVGRPSLARRGPDPEHSEGPHFENNAGLPMSIKKPLTVKSGVL